MKQQTMDLNDGVSTGSKVPQSFFSQMFGQDELDPVAFDHCYSKPWNGHPDSLRARPAKMLFMKGIPFHPGLDGPSRGQIDVETVTNKCVPPYDNVKALSVMNECDRFLLMTNISANNKFSDDWEEILKRSSASWTASQSTLFNKVMKILQTQRLASLTYEGTQNEPVMRRLSVDKAAMRVRHIFGSVEWDMKQLQWLHHVLIDHLDKTYLATYIDILQSLKSKVPHLIDRVIVGTKALESLQNLLKRPWDPATTLFTQHKPKKLPGAPILVLVPGDPPLGSIGHHRRLKFWHNQLCALGKVVTLNLHISQNMSVRDSLETVMITLKNKLIELKKAFPLRPLILVGWTAGALIACQVALIEGVSAVICLGFPLFGVLGSRGDLDDLLLESRTPTLFVVGQNACMCSVDDVEDFRERMRAESGLVVIGGGDDYFRINRLKRKLEGVTQAMVDRCIVDEIGEFLSMVLTEPLEVSPQFMPGPEKVKKEPKAKKKQKNKDIIMKGTKTGKRQYNKKQTRKGNVVVPVERMSPSSPGSSTTDTSSTCSIGENINWKQPKRGVGRPPSVEPAAKRRRMKASYVDSTLETPQAKPSPKTSDFFNNYLLESQRISVNIGSMSSLGFIRHSPPSTQVKISPPTIPSAGVPPKLGSFEAPRGFIARMDVPHVSTGPGSMLTSSSRMQNPRGQGKPKNVTFKTVTTSPSTSGITTTISSSSVNMITSRAEPSTSCSDSKPASRQLIVQKKLMDLNQLQSLMLKNTSKITPPQPQLLSSGNKGVQKAENPPFALGSSPAPAKSSLLQSALSAQKPPPPPPSPSQPVQAPRKMQIITFLKPPPSTAIGKPSFSSAPEKETELVTGSTDIPPPKVIRTYGDVKLNRQLAALKQMQQQQVTSSSAKSEECPPDPLSHLSSCAQDAVFALTQLSGENQICEPETEDLL